MCMLKELIPLAVEAHAHTSYSPKLRGESLIAAYEQMLSDDLTKTDNPNYAEEFKEHLAAWLRERYNCVSPMIAGRSKFNFKRAEKANRAEQKRYEEFERWRKRNLKTEKPIEDKEEKFRKEIIRQCVFIDRINKGFEPGYEKSLFVNSLYRYVKKYSNDEKLLDEALKIIREFNKHSLIVTERHKIFKLKNR